MTSMATLETLSYQWIVYEWYELMAAGGDSLDTVVHKNDHIRDEACGANYYVFRPSDHIHQ